MTNSQIIFNESIELMKKGIIGTTGRKIAVEYEKVNEDGENEVVKEIIDEPEEIHTFADWKARGYFVQKGQKAKAKFMIWNYTNKASKRVIEARKAAGKNDEEAPDPHYYMKEAYFFTKDQTSAAEKMLPAVV